MGLLVDGKWTDQWYDTKATGGQFKREPAKFACSVSGNTRSPFTAEANRYHLYVSLACPWASRCVIFRKLKKLEEVIGLTVVNPLMLENGWELDEDPINHKRYMHEIYTLADPNYTGRVTVPVLWDKKTNKIVCNESADIIRIFNTQFNAFGDSSVDFYPEALRNQIDEINQFVYTNINNGVYKCGFATKQDVYENAFYALFSALDIIDDRLSKQRYLVGDRLTEADWRLFTTLIRFDAVYVGHFKCNKKRIADYHHIYNYLLELYQYPGVADTVNMEHIKKHYYFSHTKINPTQIIPKGPDLDFNKPHDRDRF